jgi:hypothetical protein
MHIRENCCYTPLTGGVDLGVLHVDSAKSNTIFRFPMVELVLHSIVRYYVYHICLYPK